jgi:hypothetical protein
VIALILTSVLAASPALAAANAAESLAAADSAYREGIDARADAAAARPYFIRAAELYEAAWDGGARTPAVARNMAQARYLAGDLGTSIRDYRRGLRAFPHDPGLPAGLTFARAQVAYPHAGDLAEAARPRDTGTLLDRLPVSFARLAWAAVAVAGIGWLTLARAWVTARGGLALVGGALVLAAAAAGGWLWREDGKLRARWAQPTAVVVAATDLRTGNSEEYPRRLDARLPAGVEMKVLGERGGWLQVELGGATVGWVPETRTTRVN